MVGFIELALLAYFSYFVIYNLVLALAGFFYVSPKTLPATHNFRKFVVFIPAYKEDGVIVDTARMASNQSYLREFYEVVVIGDSLQHETAELLRSMPLIFIPVSFEQSTKVKALNMAMANYEGQAEYAVILDADNVMKPDFLATLNYLHHQGIRAIQGKRAAKNRSNNMSFLDGLSEEINNHILGKGGTAIGLSSTLKGSGMSFEYSVIKELLGKMESIGGFDRELELKLLQRGIKVFYAATAVVYDEKVEKGKVFENQRKRWISSQYFYLRKYFMAGTRSLLKGDFVFFNSAVLRNLQLPRLINIGLLAFVTLLALLLPITLHFNPLVWGIALGLTLITTLMAIPREYITYQLLISVFILPVLFTKMTFLLFRTRGANKKFIHTPHGAASIRK